jgi:hypothetical protein
MRITITPVAVLLLPVMFLSAPAFAQQARVADAAVLQRALDDRVATEEAQRETVRRVLDRDDVRELAGRMGLDLTDARSAVATLSGVQLAQAADRAAGLETALAGGQATIVISLTTLLLIIIIIILLAD